MTNTGPVDVDDETSVWIVVSGQYSTAKRSYHLNADCHHIRGARTTEITAADARRDGIGPCTSCATSEPTHNGGGSKRVLEAVQQHVYEQTGEDIFEDTPPIGTEVSADD